MKGVRFKINPNFRLTTKYLTVGWHKISRETLEIEGGLPVPGRTAVRQGRSVEIIGQYNDGRLDMIYHENTDFEDIRLQKKLRDMMKGIILELAQKILPARVRYWEGQKGMRGNGVTVKPLRRDTLGYCTYDNRIALQPFLIIFKEEWMDGVILHEMAHYRHKHHRKAFWDFLSQLTGNDAKLMSAKHDIELSPYYEYYLYLSGKD